jgi:hypothetical protein
MVNRTPEFAFQGVNDINMQKVLDNAIEGMKIRDTFVDPVTGKRVSVHESLRTAGYMALAKQFQSRGFGRHMTHRQMNVIKGYDEENLQNLLFNYMTGMAGIMTKQVAAADFLEMMKDVKQPEMFKALQKYGQDQLRNETAADKFSNKIRAFMFTWYLGGLIRPALVQLTQNFVTGIPRHAKWLRDTEEDLTKKLKAERARTEPDRTEIKALEAQIAAVKSMVGRAEKDYAKAMLDLRTHNLTEIEQKMEAQLFTDGVTVDQYIRDIYTGLGSRFDQNKMMVLKSLAAPFSWMEMYNRQSAALTRFRPAYQMYLKQGLSEAEAYQRAFESAREFVYDTHYAMGKANLPMIAQGEGVGIAAKTLYTFRSFTHNYVLSMYNDLSDGDFKTVLHSLAYVALLGGLMGLPFFKDIFEFVEKHFGYSPATSMRKMLKSTGGKTLETFGMNGIPALFGANLSGSLQIGVPFMGETPSDTIFGVIGGMKTKLVRAGEAATRGDAYRVASNLAPEFLRSPIVAAEESGIGKELFGTPGISSTPTGKAVYGEDGKPLSLGVGEAALKMVGINPAGNSREKEKAQTIKRQEQWAADVKADAAEEFRIQKLNKDPNATKNLIRRVNEINQGIKDRGIERLVTRAQVSTIIQNSRQAKDAKARREQAYKKSMG